jgi:hypothetical protein
MPRSLCRARRRRAEILRNIKVGDAQIGQLRANGVV